MGRTAASGATSSGSLAIDVFPGEGINTALLSRNNEAETTIAFEDAQTEYWDMRVTVPTGATSISSIKVFYVRGGTGNVYARFYTSKSVAAGLPTALVTDQTDTYTAYAGSGSDGGMDSFTVPASAYNGIGSVTAGDLFGLEIVRDATSVNDTYNTTWRVLGVRFTFA